MRGFAFLRQEHFGNPVSAYVLAAATFAAVVWGFMVLRRLSRLPGRTLASDLTGQVRAPELALAALYIAARPLALPHRLEAVLRALTVVVVAYRAVSMLSAAAAHAIRRAVASDAEDAAGRDAAHAASLFAKGVIWAGAALFVLSNLGFNVTSMLAGLGIGGIAVALAAQALLGDLFSAVALRLDKPFVVGDSIKIGEFLGTVESIGVKTTRVRALGGELLVLPNSSLTSARLQNFSQMAERRVTVSFSVPLGTPTSALKKIPADVRSIVSAVPGARFDRAHLSQFQESGLQFECVFYILSPDYGVFMDRQQAVLIGLLDALRADGIQLAQPARTVVLEGKAA